MCRCAMALTRRLRTHRASLGTRETQGEIARLVAYPVPGGAGSPRGKMETGISSQGDRVSFGDVPTG